MAAAVQTSTKNLPSSWHQETPSSVLQASVNVEATSGLGPASIVASFSGEETSDLGPANIIQQGKATMPHALRRSEYWIYMTATPRWNDNKACLLQGKFYIIMYY